MSIDATIAVWCLRIMGIVGVVTISAAIVTACLNYVYHSGKHAVASCRYLARRNRSDSVDLVAALERELRLRKTIDNVRAKYGNEAVEDDE